MRQLTFSEARQIEQLKVEIVDARGRGEGVVIPILPDETEFWLNALEMILETNEALSLAWKRSPNPKTDIVELVRSGLS